MLPICWMSDGARFDKAGITRSFHWDLTGTDRYAEVLSLTLRVKTKIEHRSAVTPELH